jgi:branched-chain amino acid transport system ATP-binding protein
VKQSARRILSDGQPIHAIPANRRARLGIGYCPEGWRVFPGLTVFENLAVACWGNARIRAQRIDTTYAPFPALAARWNTPAWKLSGGRQRIPPIGRSLMDAPRLLLLGEPSPGLSPPIVAGGTAVLLAEQNAAKALTLCTRAIVLRLGRITVAGPAATLASSDDVRMAFLG